MEGKRRTPEGDDLGYPKQVQKCEPCEGYGRVAIITKGPKLFESLIGRPLPCTFAVARQKLVNYRGDDAGALSMFVRNLADNLDTTACPWCRGTGVAWTLQQLTPEEAAAYRAEEDAKP